MSKDNLHIPDRILLGPGPSGIHPRVLAALSLPPISHLDPFLLGLFLKEQELLRSIFKTRNEWTFSLSGTGTSGMEASFANLIEPGDNVLIGVNGYFGLRMVEIAKRLQANVDTLEVNMGEILTTKSIKEAFNKKHYKLLGLVHAETSTGAEQLNIREISQVVHQQNSLIVLDTVTSLGGIDVDIDGWDVDIAYSASQKNLSAPSGLSPITISPRAREGIQKRKIPVTTFYTDLNAYANYWGGSHIYHHTTSSHLHYSLITALEMVMEERLRDRFNRLLANARMLWEGLEVLGCNPFIPLNYRLPVLTTVVVPQSKDPFKIREELLSKYGIEIASGLGSMKDKLWRIGLMGESSSPDNVSLLLSSLQTVMGK